MPTIFDYFSQLTCVVCSICRIAAGSRGLTGLGGLADADTLFIAKCEMNGAPGSAIK